MNLPEILAQAVDWVARRYDWLLIEHFSTILGFSLALLLLSRVLRYRERPSTSIAWLLAIVLIPYAGIPAYIVFGGRKIGKRTRKKTPLYVHRASGELDESRYPTRTELSLAAAGLPAACEGNHLELPATGEESYARLIKLIDEAKHSIDVMTFILGRDEVGRAIVARLAARAHEGLRVRLLLDGLGCLWTRGRFVDALRAAGGEVATFLPILPIQRRWSANLRNHRKIALFDGETAFIGGMNLTSEYMGPAPDPRRWIDSSAIVRGPIVRDLREVFLRDWEFATERPEPALEQPPPRLRADGPMRAQAVATGPDVEGDPLHAAMFTAMHGASNRIWIVMPYFVPDASLLSVLLEQCALGRDVRIVLPARSNHPITDLARGPFLRRLQAAGARILLHPTRMIHAKLILVDDQIAMLGSANLDPRSLFLNYEISMNIYTPGEILSVEAWIVTLMSDCEERVAESVGTLRRFGEDLGWLVSPLL